MEPQRIDKNRDLARQAFAGVKDAQQPQAEAPKVQTAYKSYDAPGMAQLFILDAIEKHAVRIATTPLHEVQAAFGENPFISPEAWHAAATEIAEAFAQRQKGGLL